MSKTITLRLDEDSYTIFLNAVNEDNRSISNLIQNLAMIKINEDSIMHYFEISGILSDKKLLTSSKKGSEQAKQRKGRFLD